MATVTTLKVNADGSGDFKTINAALESIKANTGDADVTYELVLNGTFNEAVILDSYTAGNGWASDKNITFKKAEDATAVITGRVQIGYTAGPGNNDTAHAWDGDVAFEGVTFDFSEATENSNRFEILSLGKTNELTITDCVFEGPGVIDADYNGGDPTNNNGDPNGDNAGNLLCTPWSAATNGYQGKLTVTGTSFNNGNVNFWRKSNDTDWTFTDCEFFNAPVSIQGNQSVGTLYKFEGCRFDIEINEALVGFDAFGIRVDENGGNVALNKCEFGFDNPENLEAAEGVKWTYIWTQQPNGANNNGGTIEIADSQITAGENVDNVDVFTTIDYAETTNQDVDVTGKQPTLDIFGVTAEGTNLAEKLADKDNITINGYADDTTGGSMVSGVIATDGKGGVDVEVGAIKKLFVIPEIPAGTDPELVLPAGAEVGVNAFTSFAEVFKRAFGGSTITFVEGCKGVEAGTVVYEREGILTLTGDASDYVLPQIIFANENAEITVNFDKIIDATIVGVTAGASTDVNFTDANISSLGDLNALNDGAVVVEESNVIFNNSINVFGSVEVKDAADLTSEDHVAEDEDTYLVTNGNINVYHNGKINVSNAGYLDAAWGNLNINSYDVNNKELVAAIEDAKNDGEAGASVTIDNALMAVDGANVGTVAAAALNVQNNSEVEIYWNVLLGAYGEINVSDSEFSIWNDTDYATFTNAGAFAAEDSVVTVDDMTLKAMIKIDDLVEYHEDRDITVVFLRKGDAEGISKTFEVKAGATSISEYVDYLIDGEYELTITDDARAEVLGKDPGYKINQFDVTNGTTVLNGGDYAFHSIDVNKGSVDVFGETTLTITALSGLITVNDGTVLYDTNVAGGQIAFTGDVEFKNDDPQFADEEKEVVILDNNFINDAWIAGENAEVTVNADVYLNARYMIVGGTDAKGDLANLFGGYTNANGGTLTVEGAMYAEQITVHADGLVNVEGALHAPCLFVWNKTAAVNVAEDGVLRTVFFSLKEGSATIAGEAWVIGANGEHKDDILSITDGATLTIDGGSVVTNRGILVGFGSAMNIDGGSLVYYNEHTEADFNNYAATINGTVKVTGESTIIAGFDGEGKLIFDDATITDDSVIDAAADGEVRFIGNSTIAKDADVDFAGLVFAGTMEGKAEADDFVGEASNLTINADADFGSLFIGSQYKAGVPADGSKAVVTVAGTVAEDPTTGAEVTDEAIVTIDGAASGLVVRNSGILNIEENGVVRVGADKQTIVQGEMNVAGVFTNTHDENLALINNPGPFSVFNGGKVTVKDGGIVAIGKYEYANVDWSGIPRIGLDDEEESVEYQSGAVVVEGNGEFSAFGNLTVNTYGSVTVEADGLFRVAETILNAGTITVDAAGQIGLRALDEDSNAIVIDAEGFTGFNKVIDIFGGTAETETADYIIVNGFEGLREVVINGDLYLTTLDTNILYVNSTFDDNNPAIGDEVAEDIYYGVNGFAGLYEIMRNGSFAEEDVVVNIQNGIDETLITDATENYDKVGNITLVNASGKQAVLVQGGYDFGRTDYTTLTIGETVKVNGASLKNINGYTVINGEANFAAVTAESVAEEGEELIVTDIKVNKTGVLTAGTINLDAANLIVAGELTADDVFAEEFEEPAQLTARTIDAEDAVISLTNTVAAIGTAAIDEESILAINGSVVVAATGIDNDGTVAIADNSIVSADFTGAGTIEVAGKVSLIGDVKEDVDVDFNGATLTDATLTVNAGDVTFGDLKEEIANTINGGAAAFANAKVYGDLTIAEKAKVTFTSMADTVYGDIVITGEDSELTIKEKVVVAGDITIADNGTLTVESMMSLGEYNEYTLTNGNLNLVGAAGVISGAKSTITMDYASTIAFANSAITIGTLNVDLTDYTEGTYKLFDYTGAGNLDEDYYDELVAEWNDNFVVVDNDLYLTDAPADVLYVAYTADEAVKADLIYNWNAFNTFENAVKQIANVEDDVVINVTKDLAINIADGVTADYDYVINGVDYLNDKEELTTVKLTGSTYFLTANADGIDVTITNADVNSDMILVGKGVTLNIDDTVSFDVTNFWFGDGELSFDLGNVISVGNMFVGTGKTGKISVDLRNYDAKYDAFAVNEEGEIVNKDMIGVYKVIDSAATTEADYVALFGKNWNTGYYVENGALWFNQGRGTVEVENAAGLKAQQDAAKAGGKAALMIVEKGKYTEHISFNEIETLVNGGTFEGTVSGGNIYDDDAVVEGYTDTEIAGGTYNKVVMGADRVNEGNVVREGDSTLTITGGEFNSQVVGGMAYIGNGSEPLKEGAFLEGDVELTIAGGEFKSWVYGGSIATNAALSTQAVIDGDVTITVDTTDNAVVFGKNSVLVAGSYKSGPITGDTNIVFTGKGENLTLDGNTVWGGNSADVYVNTAAGREFRTEIEGDRIVSFEAFAGDFGGNIRGFDTFEVVDGSDVNVLAGNLTDIEVWNFDTESSLSGNFANSFAGDELNVEISGDVAAEGWEIYAGSIAGFEDLDKVTIGGEEAAWDSAMAAFATDSFKLEVEGNSLKISALA